MKGTIIFTILLFAITFNDIFGTGSALNNIHAQIDKIGS